MLSKPQNQPAGQDGIALSLRGLSHAFESGPVLQGIDLDLERGALVSLLGPSGCGKSTLIRLCAGLIDLQSGRASSLEVGHRSEVIGLCFQESRLLPWRSALDNVILPLEARRVPRDRAREQAREILAQVGLEKAVDQPPSQLSGGMKMRVAVARALVLRPSLLILDEPFGALDAGTRLELQDLLLSLWRDTQMSVLLVTHSLQEAARLSSYAYIMSRAPGRIVERLDFPEGPSERNDSLSPAFAAAMARLQTAMRRAMGAGR